MKNLWDFVALLSILSAGLNKFIGHIPEGNRPRTPQIAGHGRNARHHPRIPDGKWVMKYHRGRV